MAKHTQTIRRQLLTNCLSVFDHFVRSALEGLTIKTCTWANRSKNSKRFFNWHARGYSYPILSADTRWNSTFGIIHLVRLQNFPKKLNYSLIRTPACTYQGVRNVGFTENFANVLNEWSLSEKYIPIFGTLIRAYLHAAAVTKY